MNLKQNNHSDYIFFIENDLFKIYPDLIFKINED